MIKIKEGLIMRLYCKDKKQDTNSINIDEWFKAGEDVDDFIFYKENEKISEK